MSALMVTAAADINEQHRLAQARAGEAQARAGEAIEHAKRAGALLLEVKAALGHGGLGPWLREHCAVSERTARRYMAAALGKPVPMRALKSDTVADLPDPWAPRPAFTPQGGQWYWCTGADGAMAYVIEPAAEHPGFFYISHLYDNCDAYDCTRQPVRADWVETNLGLFGLQDPAGVTWHVRPSAGVRVALETINT